MSIARRTEVYKETPQGRLSLHLFERPDRPRPGPAAVFFFGGGWTSGRPDQFFPHCRYLARRGMLAAAAAYRIRSVHQTAPPAAVADGRSAVRWLRAEADRLGVDPERLAAGGGSAGGHVAACTALISSCDETDEDHRIDPRPRALALFNPVLDTSPETGFGAPRFGERARECSPLHHVTPGAPPTILFHGTADESVPFETAERFARAMHWSGNECQLVAFEEQGHGFFNAGHQHNVPFRDSVAALDAFLTHHGFLPPADEAAREAAFAAALEPADDSSEDPQ